MLLSIKGGIMEKQIITDKLGTPISVLVSYRDWVKIEQLLETKPAMKADALDNPLDWYTLTETTNSILNELIAYTEREEFKELQKAVPDNKRIKELNLLSEELEAINSEPDNFKDLSRMCEIINKYAPNLNWFTMRHECS